MNSSLLDRIAAAPAAVLATVLRTDGHTYKKKGERALFVPGDPIPLYGNLGPSCANQELAEVAVRVSDEGRPATHRIDTRDAHDADLGYGAQCGGMMEVMLEPLGHEHRAVYAQLRERLAQRRRCYLVHHLDSGRLTLSDRQPHERAGVWVESVEPPPRLIVFGATALAERVVSMAVHLNMECHVVDWRETYLDALANADGVRCRSDMPALEDGDTVLLMSHHFARDLDVLRGAIDVPGVFIGLLSSTTRRDAMFERLRDAGVGDSALARVSCPVGIDLGAKSDFEIAVSIVGELIKIGNR